MHREFKWENLRERGLSLGRSRHRMENNIKMDLREVGCDSENWIGLAEVKDQLQDYVRTVMKLRVP